MKKILLLLITLITTIGYSQSILLKNIERSVANGSVAITANGTGTVVGQMTYTNSLPPSIISGTAIVNSNSITINGVSKPYGPSTPNFTLGLQNVLDQDPTVYNTTLAQSPDGLSYILMSSGDIQIATQDGALVGSDMHLNPTAITLDAPNVLINGASAVTTTSTQTLTNKTLTAPVFSTSTTYSYATANTVPQLNGSKQLVSSTVTPTELSYLGGATSSIQNQLTTTATSHEQWRRLGWSAGALSGFGFTNNGDGTANIASGVALLRTSASMTATLNEYTLTAVTSQTFTDNATNYVYADYNSGSPAILVTTSTTTINTLSNTLLYVVVRVGTTLKYVDALGQNVDANGKLRRRFLLTEKFAHGTGQAISANSLSLSVTAGVVYAGLTSITTPSFNTSSGGTFTYVYYNGVNYTRSVGQTTINNTQYINAGTLTTMTNNRFRVDHIYEVIDTPTELWVVQGDAQYNNLADAKLAAEPTNLPPEILGLGQVVGRVIVEKNAVSLADVSSPFITAFTGGTATTHNQLGGLQGGTTDEYYHMNSTEYTGTGTGVFVKSTAPTVSSPTLTGVTTQSTTNFNGPANFTYTTAASSSTVDLSTVNANYINVTGTVTIANLGIVQAGAQRTLVFASNPTLTNSANLILPGNSDMATGANDAMIVVSDGSGIWRCISYMRYDESYTNYTPTFTGFSANPTITAGDCRWKMLSKNTCHVIIWCTSPGTSNATTMTVTLPFTAAWTGGAGLGIQQLPMGVLNNSAQVNGTVRTRTGNSNILDVYNGTTGTAFTASGNKTLFLNFVYQTQ